MSDESKRLNWWEPVFGDAEARAVAKVVRGGYVNEGPVAALLAEAFRSTLGVRHVVPVSSGTTALFVALRACGVEPGSEVIIPDLTFVATASAVALCGAVAVPVDVTAHDLAIDPAAVEAAITGRTRAILPVHINGRSAPLPTLRRLANAHGLALVEDAAQALGSRVNGAALGTLGDAGCISLAPTKIITAGQGGLVLIDRDDLAERAVRLKDHGRTSRSEDAHPQTGFNFKLTDLQAALALAQLDRLPDRLDRARSQFKHYRSGLSGVPGLRFLETDMASGIVPLWVDVFVEGRDWLAARLVERGIHGRRFWPTIHTQPPYARDGDYPNAEAAARDGLWLPSGPAISATDVDRVIAAVREIMVEPRLFRGTVEA